MKKNKLANIIMLVLCTGIASQSAHAKDEFDLVDEDQYNRAAAPRLGEIDTVELFTGHITPEAPIEGMWTKTFTWNLYAIHAAILPNYKIITYGPITERSGRALNYDIWNIKTCKGKLLEVQTATNLFCSAQNLLANGKLLITGGDERPNGPGGSGIRDSAIYDPASDKMSSGGQMSQDRWYPSLTTMTDGRMLVHGGRISKTEAATTPEIYNPSTNTFTQLTGAKSDEVYNIANKGWYYPRTFINASGKAVFFKGNNDGLYELNVNANNKTGSLTKKASTSGGDFRFYYPAVQLEPGKVLAFKDKKKVQIIDTNKFTVENVSSIPNTRIWSDATLLADGKVVVTGGATKRQVEETAVLAVDIFDPKSKTWSVGASATNSRLYHSTAVLMPNAAVLVAGGGPPGPIKHKNAEVYYPPYLFNSDGEWATRPVINDAPLVITHKKKVKVQYSHNRKITRVTMIKLGSNTHSYDMGQLFKEVEFRVSGTTISILSGSRRKDEMTPGYYMIFLIDDLGVPSEARITNLIL